MSLVDTAVVGAKSSLELAALGPGTSVCDNVAYMCGFLAQVCLCFRACFCRLKPPSGHLLLWLACFISII